MSEFLPEVAVDMWIDAIKEVKARREIMTWVAGRLAVLEDLLDDEYHKSTCRTLRHALSDDNPKLGGAK